MGSKLGLALAALLAVAVASGATRGDRRTALTATPILTGFTAPVDVAAPRSEPGRLYVVEQAGTIRVVVNGKISPTPFLDIRSRVRSGGEQGLLSVAFHPSYAKNHKLYVDYTDLNGDTRVVEFRAKNGLVPVSTARQLLFVKQPYSNHNGGQLQFGPDGRLYIGMGDGGSGGDPQNRAQNLSSFLGKLLATNVDTKRPAVTIVGYGLRNPWRFSFDRATGDLLIGDVGQSAWEEVDFTPRTSPGLENYGWSVYEGDARYSADRTLQGPGHVVAPVVVYPHTQGCSITGGYVYRGRSFPALEGRYVYGDYCSGHVWTLRIEKGKAADVRMEGPTLGQLSSFGEDASGELYATTLDGKLYKLGA